ncbi:capsular exopolysaccharide synthesis family protein [Microbacteriaceae bacterium SG_E_30_P1]|uniref:non-specific protein-tyrosine kinase n=1 Tax=Antiquaquibacter oligotrophicus TaxID=2880260 RepID=A0ABT6KKI3_9MICO|nr:polysaccharide biosynthesis tyrosine autokinase [Antiquaquibacter oligotrophicus]MDH6180220.1 capsular exopolysaccharide synthesis family protein [Antiquaquibacter oligotrophicus]UDF14033.1 polysaccharide biosynthesis tyrosine autokinase [Antiquaquibacter oligotrophicus]
MELRDYVRVLRRSWILIALSLLLAVGIAAALSLVQTPRYTASSKVFVSTQAGETTQDLVQGNNFTQARVKTYASLVTTPIVLEPVIDKLRLDVTAAELALAVSSSSPLDTTLITISVTDTDPKQAADIANAASQSLSAVVRQIESTEETGSPVKLTRVQDATVPTVAVSPNVPLNLGLGFFIGLVVGVVVAVLREVLDTRVRNERDIESITDIPIIGGIAFDPRAVDRPLIVHEDPRSPRAESFRTLRTNLQFVDIERGSQAFVTTSAVEQEGKSTTSANLAISLADVGKRVLLVDADLRRPKVAEYMGLEGAVGLTDVLIGSVVLSDVVQPWGTGTLSVLPAGTLPPNPSELLSSAAMQKLVDHVLEYYDAVIFDAPPLLPVTDAAILAKKVGGVILVAAAGRTQKNQVKGALTALRTAGADASGIVLTMLPAKGPDAYGYGRYGYYGYGSGAVPAVETPAS